MPLASGLAAQLGIVDEVTYGTPVTVTRFYDLISEDVNLDIARLEAKGLRAGARVLRSSQWIGGRRTVGGPVGLEVWNKGYGLVLKHMFGAVTSSQPDVGGNPTVWDHTFTPGDLAAKSLTVQVGRPDSTGTVRAFTYKGVKIAKWELTAAIDRLADLKLTTLAQDEDTTIALAAATAPTGLAPFVFTQGTLQIAAAAVDVKEFNLSGDNGLTASRPRLGSALTKEPLEASRRDFLGTLSAYFTDLTAYNRFVNGTEAALVLDFVGPLISGIYNFELKVTTNVRFDGTTPGVSGPEELMQPLKIKCTGPTTDASAITVLYRTTDTAP